MKLRRSDLFVGAAVVALMAGSPAGAFGSDYYLAFGAGFNVLSPTTLSSTTSPLSSFPRTFDFSTGFAGTAAIGHHVTPNLRLEGELSIRHNALSGVTVAVEGPQSFDGGSAKAFGVMANGWFDIPTGSHVMPYVGGGIGAAHVNFNASTLSGGACGCAALDFATSQFLFAYQLGAGVAIGLNNGAAITLDYRYFMTSGFSVPFTGAATGTGTGGSYSAQSAMVGFRMPIGGAP